MAGAAGEHEQAAAGLSRAGGDRVVAGHRGREMLVRLGQPEPPFGQPEREQQLRRGGSSSLARRSSSIATPVSPAAEACSPAAVSTCAASGSPAGAAAM